MTAIVKKMGSIVTYLDFKNRVESTLEKSIIILRLVKVPVPSGAQGRKNHQKWVIFAPLENKPEN